MEIEYTSIDEKTFNARLRNSTTGILGNAQFLSEEYLTLQQQEMVRAILTCANDLKDLADKMLEKKTKNIVTFSISF